MKMISIVPDFDAPITVRVHTFLAHVNFVQRCVL